MTQDTLIIIKKLLEAVQDDVENPDASYNLRTARQLLSVLEQRDEKVSVALKQAVSDDELRERLRDLGYLSTNSGCGHRSNRATMCLYCLTHTDGWQVGS